MKNLNQLTLHIRLTKKCNANCSYCSSYSQNEFQNKVMKIDDFKISIEFLKELIERYKIGGNRDFISIQLIGGEISILPIDYLQEVKQYLENTFNKFFKEYQIGVQSNLIASQTKIKQMVQLFDHIGTSFDHFTNQRTLKDNPVKYKEIFIKNISIVKKQTAKNVGGVVVLDEKMLPFLTKEIEIANEHKRDVVLRPVFSGGMPYQEINDLFKFENSYIMAFENWFLKQNILIEPFYSSLLKRIAFQHAESYSEIQEILQQTVVSCPSQSHCAEVSLNLDPNGDIFLCQDMSDSQQYRLGNTLEHFFEEDKWNTLKKRETHLQQECFNCDYLKECQGGCMKEALDHTRDIYGKTKFCSTWKKLYAKIDEKINTTEKKLLIKWIEKITVKR